MARKSAVKATTQASNQIKALLVGSPQALRDDLVVRSLLQLATRCAQLPGPGGLQVALRSLGRRWLLLHEEILTLDTEIRRLVRTTVPALLDRCGIGIHSAAQLIITAGGNPTRLHSDAAFAALCGVSPVQSQQRPSATPPAQPRRRPRRQQRAVNHRQQQAHPRPAEPRLRRQAHRARRHPQGHPADAEALHRPRSLWPDHHRVRPTAAPCSSGLT